MGHKRKRQSDATAIAEDEIAHAAKVQITEEEQNEAGILSNHQKKGDKGLRKQMRSERRANNSQKPKHRHFQPKETNRGNVVDDIAQGEDFVALVDDAEPKSTRNAHPKKREFELKSKPAKGARPVTKATLYKKASPRSIRLAAKAEKAKAAVKEEYGEDALNEMEGSNTGESSKKTPRFICFVGNLPYDCTMEQLQIHFQKLSPKSIRHPTDKNTGKSKGYAFLEFSEFDKMKTCLKLYHHSIFEPERLAHKQNPAADDAADVLPRIGDKKNKGRMINVELTAGGGGKGGARQKKIKDKNVKLEEQRTRIREQEKKKAVAKEKKAQKQAVGDGPNGVQSRDVNGAGESRGDIHPSRLKRVKG